MQTLALVDGDLVVASGSYLTVSGVPKVRQDLYYALHEPYGEDPYHPRWGSILDRFVGQPLTAASKQSVLNEVSRVVKNYMAVQADKVNSSAANSTRSVLDTSDVVTAIEQVAAQSVGDTILVGVTLRTMNGSNVTVTRQLAS